MNPALFNLTAYPDTELPFRSREEICDELSRMRSIDLVVVGGGIHGACAARLAAFNGLRTVLLESGDYANATSSRSSKMAHGGLRYLELLDFAQVREGLRARADLFAAAPHLVQPRRFLVPVPQAAPLFRLKMKLGLSLYDFLGGAAAQRHSWISREQLNYSSFNRNSRLAGCFLYTDGILNDTRLVLENVLSARREGAVCLNYARVDGMKRLGDGRLEVAWSDQLDGGKQRLLVAGAVMNCCGPWVAELGRVTPSELQSRIRYSRGSHLIFNRPWSDPPIFLPLEGKARYYWVWPHPVGTMVGTTEREVLSAERDPLPSADEVEEILERLGRDLPESGLDRSSLCYGFAGVRTLLYRDRRNVTELSRRHEWQLSGAVLSLAGGKFTTAALTAEEGLRLLFRTAQIRRKLAPVGARKLPGAAAPEEVERFLRVCDAEGVPRGVAERAARILGGSVGRLIDAGGVGACIDRTVLASEVKHAVTVEQGCTIEDLMRRRLELEAAPGHGLNVLEEVGRICAELMPKADIPAQIAGYRERMAQLHAILNVPTGD